MKELPPQPADRDPRVFAQRPPMSILKSHYPIQGLGSDCKSEASQTALGNLLMEAFGVVDDPITEEEKAWAKKIQTLTKKCQWFGLTCCIRLSAAINGAAIAGHGWLIRKYVAPKGGFVKLGEYRPNPDSLVIIGTSLLARYLNAVWGDDHRQSFQLGPKFTVSEVFSAIADKPGVIVFEIGQSVKGNSQGHATLWDGKSLKYDPYGEKIPNMASTKEGLTNEVKHWVKRASFWEVPASQDNEGK